MPTASAGPTTAVVILSLATASCSPAEAPPSHLELYVSPDSYDFSENPDLFERIVASPYGYFRFVNERFTQTLCARFAEDLDDMPKVNLHGDGHVAQYSVTGIGRGLTDFDDASVGPAIIDLVRVGVSIELIAEDKGWSDAKAMLVEEFLRGYRAALEDPELMAPQPRIVDRIRAQFDSDRGALLDWADSLMDPERLPPEPVQRLIGPFAEAIHEDRPELAPDYFEVKKAGRHRLGVGSALDEKYLLRVEGPTAADGDDVLVEIKEIRDLSGIECIERLPRDPGPILNAQSRIAYQPYRFTGFVHVDNGAPRGDAPGVEGTGDPAGRSFWLHTWDDHYYEISGDDLEAVDEGVEIVFDVGVQLGRGHPKDITPDDSRLRRAQLESLDRHQADIRRAIDELAEQTVRAWERFRTDAGR